MIKPEPFELRHRETTEEEYRKTVLHGGWVEYHRYCPLCETSGPHRHYICSDCGQMDFINDEFCFECWHAHENWRIRRELYGFLRKYGASLQRLGVRFWTALLLLTIASWRLG